MLKPTITQIVNYLKIGRIVILPTDTIYGFATSCQTPEPIQTIYRLKRRALDKQPIILVANWQQWSQIGQLTPSMQAWIEQQTIPTTLIVAKQSAFPYSLTIWSTDTVAIRLVKWTWLANIINQTGPIISTSCNISHQPPLLTLTKLKSQWAHQVDLIVNQPARTTTVSRIFDWTTQQFIR